ncbi:DNA ligase [Actinidia chinensis var. chinensis]|uniref:DNA ligase n=1 Tax=Actinidia chinensis var. chinensis TaxID=1590841 RepID=A0A2R6PYP7_ACTCC|nr:DNA ligase [Actinidia chinensis var. chinensis]
MAYLPPHKRHSTDAERPSPKPESLAPQFHKKLSIGASGSNVERRKNKQSFPTWKIVYANNAISRWFAVGLADDTHFASSTRLEPISLKSFEHKLGEPPLTLVLDSHLTENKEVKGDVRKSPWESVTEDVKEDLLSSFQNLRKVMECQELEVKPALVARFGKILFHGSPSVSLETVRSSSVAVTTLRQLKRSFYTTVPLSYMENITNEVVPNIRLNFEEEKELYNVKLSDSKSPDSIISCKCRLMNDCKRLELYKSELNQVRHLVFDISCLDRELDLRLMLCAKRILTTLTDDEKSSISSLIDSAVLDPDVKGGLRWPLGKASCGDRYTVVGVWHTNSKTFRNASTRLKVRHADRFDFRTSSGEVTGEVSLKMTGIVSQLQEQNIQIDQVTEMLKDNLKLIWDYFL